MKYLFALLLLTSCCSPRQANPWDMTAKQLQQEEIALRQKLELGNGTSSDVLRLREVRYQLKMQREVLK